jgi:hypothetical protein
MNILEHVNGQIGALNLPLCAITLTAIPQPDTPVLLMLHWHAFRRDFLYGAENAQPVAFRSVPSSMLQINERWNDLAAIDLAALEAGWELGAWDVTRQQRLGCLRPGAESSESLECMQAFGAYPDWMGGNDLVVSEAPDAEELFELGANSGYFTWSFRPVKGGLWAELADDETLKPDGSRDPACPLLPAPAPLRQVGHTTYRFGKRTKLVH